MRKIPKKYTGVCLAVGMSVLMSAMLSAMLIANKSGISSDTMWQWLTHDFPLSFLTSLPISLIAFPIVQRIVTRITD